MEFSWSALQKEFQNFQIIMRFFFFWLFCRNIAPSGKKYHFFTIFGYEIKNKNLDLLSSKIDPSLLSESSNDNESFFLPQLKFEITWKWQFILAVGNYTNIAKKIYATSPSTRIMKKLFVNVSQMDVILPDRYMPIQLLF